MLILLSLGEVAAQNGWAWANGIAGTDVENGNGIAVDGANGWVYITGTWNTNSNLSATWGPDFTTPGGGSDIFVTKYDTNGTFIWAFSITSAGDDVARDIAVDGTGSFYLTGSFTQATDFRGRGPGPALMFGTNDPQLFVARYDSSGALQWAARSTGSGGHLHTGISLAADATGVYVVGSYLGSAVFEGPPLSGTGITSQFSTGGEHAFIAHYSPTGNIVWLTDAGGTGSDVARGVSLDNSSVYFIGDYTSSSFTLYDGARPGAPSATLSNAGGSDIFLAFLSKTNGVLGRIHRIYSPGDDVANACKSAGTLLVTGSTESQSLLFPGMFSATNSNPPVVQSDMFVASITMTTSTTHWAKIENGSGSNSAVSIDTDANGNAFVLSTFDGPLNLSGNLISSHSGGSDLLVAQYNSTNGQLIGNQVAGSGDPDRGSELTTAGTGIYVTGTYTNDFLFPPAALRNDHNSENVFVSRLGMGPPCDASFNYAQTSYCQFGFNATPTLTGNTGGTFSATPSGLVFANPTTGEINLASSSPGITYSVTYTAPAGCSTTQLISILAPPTAAFAGIDQTGSNMCGLTSTTLSANTPGTGTGSWSLLSGSGGLGLADRFDPASQFTGSSGSTYTLGWVTENAPCPADTDEVIISFPAFPSPSLTGPDQSGPEMCGEMETTLAGNDPQFGTGSWSVLSGIGGNIQDINDPLSGFTGISGNNYTLNWMVSNAPCGSTSDQQIIHFQLAPIPPDAGPNQQVCGDSVMLSGSSPGGGSGSWSVVSGGGNFASFSQAQTVVTNLNPGFNEFQWTIKQGICPDSSRVQITSFLTVEATPDGDTTTCQEQFPLYADLPSTGFGQWYSSNPAILFDDPFRTNALVSGMDSGPNAVYWLVTNGACIDSAKVILQFVELNPDAGIDQEICAGDTVFLSASNTQTGYWELLSGSGTIQFPSLPNTQLTGLGDSLTQLLWHYVQGGCDQWDTMSIVRNLPPTLVNAGPDQTLSGTTSTFLAAATPDQGTGSWASIDPDSPAIIDAPSDGNSRVSELTPGMNGFLWVVSQAPCPSQQDEVWITVEDLLIPDAFSPNGDNVNDRFVINGIEAFSGTVLNIFNRWGNEVFTSSNYQNEWAGGNQNGKPLSDDTYFYILDIPNRGMFKGSVMIRRKK